MKGDKFFSFSVEALSGSHFRCKRKGYPGRRKFVRKEL